MKMSVSVMTTPSKERPSRLRPDAENPPAGWQTPSKVMQKFRMKKRALDQRLTAPAQHSTATSDNLNSRDLYFGVTRCDDESEMDDGLRNPFKVPRLCSGVVASENGVEKVEVSSLDADAAIWRLISSPRRKIREPHPLQPINYSFERSPLPSLTFSPDDIPIDWSLKSRVRCVFPVKKNPQDNLPDQFSANQESSSVTAFVRRVDLLSSNDFLIDNSFETRLKELTYVWHHPHLPWMHSLSRSSLGLGPVDGKSSQVSGSIATDQVIQKALRKDWEASLKSAFFLLKVKQCPYIYVCASTFTVLFRASGLDGSEEIQAFVSPTTKGMREALAREDINFTMPLRRRTKPDCEEYESPNVKDDSTKQWYSEDPSDEDDVFDDELLSQLAFTGDKATSSCSTAAVGKSRSDTQSVGGIDGKPESMILIEASETHLFFGYFSVSRWGWNVSGPLAGVPPSIYAPVAFVGASLTSLKIRRGEIEEGGQKYTTFDISGPVMPHVIPSLMTLFCERYADYELRFTTMPGSSSFNSPRLPALSSVNSSGKDDENEAKIRFSVENLRSCGLNESTLEFMCRKSSFDKFKSVESSRCISKISVSSAKGISLS